MKSVPSTEAKNKFGEVLDDVQHETVAITRNGRVIAYMVSAKDYDQLQEAQDDAWATRAEAAAKEGFIGTKASAALLASILDAKA